MLTDLELVTKFIIFTPKTKHKCIMAHPRDRVRRRAKAIDRLKQKRKTENEKRKNLKQQIAIVIILLVGIIFSAFYITKI